MVITLDFWLEKKKILALKKAANSEEDFVYMYKLLQHHDISLCTLIVISLKKTYSRLTRISRKLNMVENMDFLLVVESQVSFKW